MGKKEKQVTKNKMKLFEVLISIIIISMSLTNAFATTWYPDYDGDDHGAEVTGICPVSKASSNDNGHLEAFIYSDGAIDTYACVWALFTPSATTSYSIGTNYDYHVYKSESNAVAQYTVKIIVVRVSDSQVIHSSNVRTFEPSSAGQWYTDSDTESKSTSCTLTDDVEYKLMVQLFAYGIGGSMVGQSKTDMDTLDVNWISVTTGGGCPFVATWDGSEFIEDNNILSASEENQSSVDVSDYYKLQNPIVKDRGKYRIQISENEDDHDYLNEIQLLAVKHDPSIGVVPSPNGDILTYSNPQPPINCITDEGIHILDYISNLDHQTYQVQAGAEVILDFGKEIGSETPTLLLAIGCPKSPLYIQIPDSNNEWNTIDTIWIKRNYAFYGVSIPNWNPDSNGDYKIKLLFSELSEHNDIDYIALDTEPQVPVTTVEMVLVKATHSIYGNVKQELSSSDDDYVELTNGQFINLEFVLRGNKKGTVDFILYSKGYYLTP